jgi:hypothetical protein
MSQTSSNHFKFGASEISSATRGGFSVGVKNGADYGPTSITGFWNGVTPPVGGYTIYVDKASQGPSIHIATDNNHCIMKLKAMGATGTTISDVLTWAEGQSNMLVLSAELTLGDLPGARSGYYISDTLCGAVTGGTQLINSYFYVGAGQGPMCDASSGGGDNVTGLTPGTNYVYDVTNNKVREITTYSLSNTFILNGSCSTPSCGGGGGGARSGYWYATTRPAAITGGTQVNDVTFSGGNNTLCNSTSANSNSFSSLNGYIYIYNADTGDVKTFYGTNSSSITSMSSCLNTNTPVYYYSTMSNDCYGNQTLTNVSFNGGVNFCSATGFNANELSSLAPNTYYMRDPFTDNFRSFYCAYNGSVSFSTSCSQYTCN